MPSLRRGARNGRVFACCGRPMAAPTPTGAKRESVRVLRAANGRPYGEGRETGKRSRIAGGQWPPLRRGVRNGRAFACCGRPMAAPAPMGAKWESVRVLRAANGCPYGEGCETGKCSRAAGGQWPPLRRKRSVDVSLLPVARCLLPVACCLSQSIKGEKGTTSFTASVGVMSLSPLSMSMSS